METRIAEMREVAGIKRSTLAARIGVTYDRLSKWETGANEISLDYAQRIAHVLGCRISDLLYEAPQRDERFDEIARAYRSMTEEGREALLATARGLAQAYTGETATAGVAKTA